MSDFHLLDSAALDAHITGNYGEDQFDDGEREHLENMRAVANDLTDALASAHTATEHSTGKVRQLLMELDRTTLTVDGELSPTEQHDLHKHVENAVRELRDASRVVAAWTRELDDLGV